MSVGCVIPAAGRGERMGGGTPKALRTLAGATLLEHAVRAMAASRSVRNIVVAAPADRAHSMSVLMASLRLEPRIDVIVGGDTRSESVRRGVAALPPGCTTILVHDAARPLVPPDMVDRVVAAVEHGAPAVVPVVPVVDTIKQVDEAGRVVRTVDRSELRAAQTPQGFAAEVLRRALAAEDLDATDDTGIVERLGVPVIVVPGHEEAMKVTRPIDLLLAEAIVRRRAGRVH
jgi:2-C-methyl-D-erythritol 4-phosphate cytidylyltransferase